MRASLRLLQMLRQAFEEHGEVIDAFVAYNGRSSRGFGYVTFKNPPDAAAALKAQQDGNVVSLGEEERAREIRVEMARERPGPRPEPRERTSDRAPREGGERSDRPARAPRDGEGRGGRGESVSELLFTSASKQAFLRWQHRV